MRIAALALATVAPGPSLFAIVISAFFVFMFFAVPAAMLSVRAGAARLGLLVLARAQQRMRIEQIEAKALEELGMEPDGLVADYGPDQLVPVLDLSPEIQEEAYKNANTFPSQLDAQASEADHIQLTPTGKTSLAHAGSCYFYQPALGAETDANALLEAD